MVLNEGGCCQWMFTVKWKGDVGSGRRFTEERNGFPNYERIFFHKYVCLRDVGAHQCLHFDEVYLPQSINTAEMCSLLEGIDFLWDCFLVQEILVGSV